jgi:protein-disulfide isomerase
MDKRFWVIVVGLAVVLSGVFFFTSRKAEAPTDNAAKGTVTNHVSGSASTGVKLTEYGDYQCPACGRYYQPVKEVTEKYKDRIQFQFRNFPLVQIHRNAMAGARAAEAADLQGKYWEMHDILYENQPSWSESSSVSTTFEGFATSLGMDLTKFKTDYKSKLVNDRIQADIKEGGKIPVESTPTFLLDGKKISNPDPTVEAFSKIIDAEIAKKTGQPTPAQ